MNEKGSWKETTEVRSKSAQQIDTDHPGEKQTSGKES